MDKYELKKWVDENPHMDPRSPKVKLTETEYGYADKHIHLEHSETGEQKSFNFECGRGGCGGCGGYFCSTTAPIPGNPYPDFRQDEDLGPS
jgi:hypothetical protein